MRLAPPAWFIAASLCAVPACKKHRDPEADGRKLTAESTYDATKPIIHDGYRFRLDHPGPGWKLMQRDDARNLVDDANAGAMGPQNLAGVVMVERMPGATIDDLHEMTYADIPAEKIHETKVVRLGGLDARRTTYTQSVNEIESRYVSVIALREGYSYQLLAWTREDQASTAQFDRFFDAFSFTEGEVVGEVSDHPPVTEADGLAWQIRDGQFRSAISGIDLDPDPPWRLIIGREARESDPNAELLLAIDAKSTYLTVTAYRHIGDHEQRRQSQREDYRERFGEAQPLPARTIAGHSMPTARHALIGSRSYDVGLVFVGDAFITIAVVYPDALRDEVMPSIDALLGSITLSSATDRAALLARLRARPDTTRLMVANAAYYNGRFRDFRHQLTWDRPQGLFDVRAGDGATTEDSEAVLWIEQPPMGLMAQLQVYQDQAARRSELHDALAEDFDERKDSATMLVETKAYRTTGLMPAVSGDFRYGILSFEHNGHAVVMSAWAPTAIPGVGAAIDALLGGLRAPTALPEHSVRGRRYVDQHYGVSVEEPTGDWTRTHPTTKWGTGRIVRWQSRQSEIVLTMVPTGGRTDDGDWLAAFIEQKIRDKFSQEFAKGETPETTTGTLDGRPSRRLLYSKVQVELVQEQAALYALAMVNVSDADARRFRASVQWR
ncbi:MAG: hypothetical protein K0V04_14275 [Deltaproteobacteria bacterium]|nr:hypothetical protein [Deltaproteobacteria bacterium]